MTQPISFPAATNAFSLPLLFAGQAQKEFFINQSFSLIDALLQHGVTAALSTPPVDVHEGDIYLVAEAATEDWSGQDAKLAILIGGGWYFVQPFKGMTIFDRSENVRLYYDEIWQRAPDPTLPTGGATIDVEARQMLSELLEVMRHVGIFAPAS